MLSHVSLYKNARLHSLLVGVFLDDGFILVGFSVQEINQEVSPRLEVILSVATRVMDQIVMLQYGKCMT